jgi:hypothetical protein
MKKFYDSLLETKTEVLIFVSEYDRDDPAVGRLIDDSTARQKRRGIKIRALNPLGAGYSLAATKKYLQDRKNKNIAVRLLPRGFVFPSQIIIFDDKIGITSLKKELITTVIENENIARTFKTFFEYMWTKAEIDHRAILEGK